MPLTGFILLLLFNRDEIFFVGYSNLSYQFYQINLLTISESDMEARKGGKGCLVGIQHLKPDVFVVFQKRDGGEGRGSISIMKLIE